MQIAFTLSVLCGDWCVAYAAPGGQEFHSHISQSAQVARRGQVRFTPYPGSNPANHLFLANSLSVGVVDGIEVGTIPAAYVSGDGKGDELNLTSKARLLHREKWDAGVGTTHIWQRLYHDQYDLDVYQVQASLIFNYFYSSVYAAGLAVNESAMSLSAGFY